MKLNKTILIPLLAAVVEFVKQCTGYEVPFGDHVDVIADGILWLVATLGIWMHPKKDTLSDAERNYISSEG